MHEAHEARAGAGRGPFQHLLVAVGIPEREDRPTPDKSIDPHWLPRAVVNEVDLTFLDQHRLAIGRKFELNDAGRAHHLLGRNAVYPFGEDTHEFHAATGNDESLKTVGP